MRVSVVTSLLIGCVAMGTVSAGRADVLSIYDVQSNTTDGDQSVYDGEIHDIVGGVVTHIWFGGKPRVYLQDPERPEWGGIVAKDWHSGTLANNVNIGDWVSFTGILIEEYRGTTHLQYNEAWAPDVAFTVESSGHPIPSPRLLTAATLPAPADHAASEPYESMVATLENVTVGQKDLGKADDNYELWQGTDVAWATDYMNVDAGAPYDPRIVTGSELLRITGLVEQYTNLDAGWDYYQLDTCSAADIVVPEPGTALLLVVLAAGGRVRRSSRR